MLATRCVSSIIALSTVLGASMLGTTACSSKHRDQAEEALAEEPSTTGSLRMALSARGASGALYRLRDAQFNVRQDNFGFFITLLTEDNPLATTLEATLPVGNFIVDLFGGDTLEKVENGQTTRVAARLLSPQTQTFQIRTNEETFVGYRFETNGEVVDFGQGRLVITLDVTERQGDPLRSVIETSQVALTGLSLRETLDMSLANAGPSSVGAEDIYHSIIDSYNTSPGRDASLRHCDSENTSGSPSLNTFPLACPRLEGQQFDNLDRWFPIAMVNRLDLAPVDGEHCGQQRMIFANSTFIGNGRMFIIVESQIPNPNPGCGISACRPIAEFWSSLSTVTDARVRGRMLREAFLTIGTGPMGPFMNADNLGPNGGQIRTNNFNDFQWTLREFHLDARPNALAIPTSVAEAPNGELWNDLSPLPQGSQCRSSFLASLGNLLSDNLATLGFPVDDACEDAESPNDFFRQDYLSHLRNGSGLFENSIDNQLLGTGLSASDVANRARFAGSCMGCHLESGGLSLGRGISAPNREDFVHVSELSPESCGNGDSCFRTSEALRNVFLPHRINVQDNFLSSGGFCGGAGDAGVDGGGSPIEPPFPGSDAGVFAPGGPRRAAGGVRRTLGGQPVIAHAH